MSSNADALYSLIAQILGLRGIYTRMDMADRLGKGLSGHTVIRLHKNVGLSATEVSTLIASRRTIDRRIATRRSLKPAEIKGVLRVARVFALARLTFSGTFASTWMRAPNRSLGNRAPLAKLATESGARAVEEQLYGIQNGIYA